MNTTISIVIADDHPIFRRGLRAVLETDSMIHVVAEAGDGTSALALVRQHRPDIAILDIDMPSPDGLEIARIILTEELPVSVVILSMYNDEALVNAALDAEVMGYVVKDSATSEIIGCLRSVAAGQHYFSPSLSDFLLSRGERSGKLLRTVPSITELSATERRVMRLLAEAKTSREIAEELSISVRTVENHRAHIGAKLGLGGRHALLAFAMKHRSEL